MSSADDPKTARQPQPPSHAMVGTWRLVSYDVEVASTGERFPAMGERPTGYTIFSGEGRVWFMLTGDGRQPGDSDRDRAQLLETLIAYSGRYRIEGDVWVTAVDVAWNPAWVGTEQRRQFALDGDRLQVRTPWRVMPNWADKGETRSIITFERAVEG
ncbi:lipocalin-like domain-containing protein [Luteimonas aestuarii]|uniref:Lipocalin-like domain-containing protein n=1 Tax=Luteimonas aestuarii TaxID=453837 RepID=A0A4R5TJU2_9GAMM|nr:lipocalin-like domain-containing protein [Luteimonas aestuarii]TDK21498.1 lipocalin-like domain-containing protein [Luteimonas aestuarii]